MKKELRSRHDDQLEAFLAEQRRMERARIVITVTPPDPSMYAGLFYSSRDLVRGLPWLEA